MELIVNIQYLPLKCSVPAVSFTAENKDLTLHHYRWRESFSCANRAVLTLAHSSETSAQSSAWSLEDSGPLLHHALKEKCISENDSGLKSPEESFNSIF